jgi:Activator of Hsp90 ATPase homolog 1-like protein
MNDFTTSFVVDQTSEKVFDAINNVRGWWGEDVEGSNDKVGDEFTYRVQDIHNSKLRVIELIPNEKVVWLVLDNHMNFVEDQTEWVGTTINFEIGRKGDQTEVRFAHLGLIPQHECFSVCSNAWGSLMHGSLPRLITTGTGQPYK